jgi:hypothetical protein
VLSGRFVSVFTLYGGFLGFFAQNIGDCGCIDGD